MLYYIQLITLYKEGFTLKKRYIALVTAISFISPVALASDNDSWLESYNRAMFNFNYQVDKYTLKPLAKGYRAITNQDVRNRVSSLLSNTKEPISFANHTLQGNFKNALISVGRFLINSTLGLAGTFDVASGWGLKGKRTGFDETLATYCVPDGPFFIAPIFGPFTVRAAIGYGVDAYTDPIYWAALNDKNYSDKITWGYFGANIITSREKALDLVEGLEKNSVDFYAASKSAYLQNRQKFNKCQTMEETPSYDFDFDEDFEDE